MGFALLCLLLVVRDYPDRMPSPVPATATGIGEKLLHASRAWERGDHVQSLREHLTVLFNEYGFPTNWWRADYSLFLKQLGGSAFLALVFLTILRMASARQNWREHFLLLVTMVLTIVTFDFFLRYLYPGNFRHQLFLLHPLFLFCTLFWLRERPRLARADTPGGSLRLRLNGAMAQSASVCIGVIFLFQWAANASALVSDTLWPFSATALVKDSIPDSEKSLVAVDTDYTATPLAMWLPHARFFSTMGNAREFSYVVWDKARHDRRGRRANLFQQLCRRVTIDPTQTIYYLNTYPSVERNYRLHEIATLPNDLRAAVPDESFRVYTVECPSSIRAPERFAKSPIPESDNAVF